MARRPSRSAAAIAQRGQRGARRVERDRGPEIAHALRDDLRARRPVRELGVRGVGDRRAVVHEREERPREEGQHPEGRVSERAQPPALPRVLVEAQEHGGHAEQHRVHAAERHAAGQQREATQRGPPNHANVERRQEQVRERRLESRRGEVHERRRHGEHHEHRPHAPRIVSRHDQDEQRGAQQPGAEERRIGAHPHRAREHQEREPEWVRGRLHALARIPHETIAAQERLHGPHGHVGVVADPRVEQHRARQGDAGEDDQGPLGSCR
jgi:hypothetical protein